jgi:1-acyl-sn-glycerol-3-phosphate acyltransferase
MIAFLSTGLTAAAIIVMGSTTALAIPLLFLNYNLYRFVTSFIEACFLSWQSFLLRYSYGIRFVVTGAPLKRGTNVLMSNHPTRTDWMMSWPVFESRGFIQDLHFVAKTDVRAVPVIGWCMQQCRHVFLQRRWEADEAAMTSSLQLLAGVPGESYSLLLFPEGTGLEMLTCAHHRHIHHYSRCYEPCCRAPLRPFDQIYHRRMSPSPKNLHASRAYPCITMFSTRDPRAYGTLWQSCAKRRTRCLFCEFGCSQSCC